MEPALDTRPFQLAGRRQGVLLLHGFTGTPFEMRALGERLHARGLSVTAPLLAGHGLRPQDLQRTGPADWYASAERGLDELAASCDRIAVAGLSLGSLLAIELAIRRPEQVSALVLMGAPYRLSGKLGLLLLLYNYTPMLWIKPYFPKLGAQTEVCDPAWKGRNPAYDVLPMRSGRKLLATMRRIRRQLDRVRCPCLVLHGARDDTVLAWGARAMAARLGADTVWQRTLPRSAHLVTLDFDRERAAESIERFCDQVL
ncbi:MAG: alpha/beta fold hydrolase [Deltaproteobacteria bacterium]|nr:alpha/beta fold hydrolase [Deltaproteobacteria bacterium]